MTTAFSRGGHCGSSQHFCRRSYISNEQFQRDECLNVASVSDSSDNVFLLHLRSYNLKFSRTSLGLKEKWIFYQLEMSINSKTSTDAQNLQCFRPSHQPNPKIPSRAFRASRPTPSKESLQFPNDLHRHNNGTIVGFCASSNRDTPPSKHINFLHRLNDRIRDYLRILCM
jgi:hypothetical protein